MTHPISGTQLVRELTKSNLLERQNRSDPQNLAYNSKTSEKILVLKSGKNGKTTALRNGQMHAKKFSISSTVRILNGCLLMN